MSISTTQIGNNTYQITLSGETSWSGLITALDTVITNNGWSQADVTNQYNRIYSAPNADGVTFKYIGITIDPNTQRISTTAYESWNASTHVGTNEAWTFGRAGSMGMASSFCDIIVMISPQWLILQSFIRNQPSIWHGVIELQREATEDTGAAGYPCFVWVSSATMFESLVTNYASIGSTTCVSFPRTRSGATGINAAVNISLQTPIARFGTPSAGISGVSFQTLASMTTYGYDTNKRLIHSVRPVFNNTELHGRMYGLKLAYNIGSPYNRVAVPVDSKFNYSATGTSTEHWVLPMNPTTGPANVLAAGAGNGYVTSQSQTATSSRGCVAVGQFFYVANASGVLKFDNTTGTIAGQTTVTGADSNVTHIIYDGFRYVYGASVLGVTRIDTQNGDAVTTLSLPSSQAGGRLAYDGTYLWAIQRGTTANISVYKIDPATFTVSSTISCGNASAVAPMGLTVDVSGNAYALVGTGQIYKIVGSSNVISNFATAAGGYTSGGLYFNGSNLVVGIANTNSSPYFYVYYFSMSGGLINNTSLTGTSNMSANVFVDIAKVGIYDMFGNLGTSNLIVSATNVLNNAAPFGSVAYTVTGLACDGNKLLFTNASSTFYVWSNVFRPDEAAIAYGKVLFPK